MTLLTGICVAGAAVLLSALSALGYALVMMAKRSDAASMNEYWRERER